MSQLLQLYLKYQLDFDLFGYSLEEHLDYVRPGVEAMDPAVMARLPRGRHDRLQDLLDRRRAQRQRLTVEEPSEGAQDPNYQDPSLGIPALEEVDNALEEQQSGGAA